MKRCRSFFRSILNIFLIVSIIPGVFGAETTDALKRTPRQDSLVILSSLVNSNKICNNLLAIHYAKRALAIARLMKSDTAMAEAYKLLGIASFQSEKDSSFFYFSTALKIADNDNLLYLKIPIIYNLAMFYSAAYNYQDAIKMLDSSLRMARSIHDYPGISRAYNALGNIYFSTHDLAGARQAYDSALLVARDNMVNQQIGVALGNLAKNEFEKDNKKSISLQKEALNYLKKEKGTEEEMAFIFINIGNRYSIPDSALYYYKSALKLAVNANLSKIQFGAYNSMAYSYLDMGNIREAESCLKDHAIPVALKENDHDWLSSLYDTYADVCVAQRDYKKALEMQKKALRERIRDYKQKAPEQLKLVSALLDLKNKELTIQNEEKELLIQRNRLQRTELWLAIALLLIFLSVFGMIVMQQRNRAKLHREQIGSAKRIIAMEETEKGRTARELHDLTGQLVLGISGTVENIEFPDPKIKDQIQTRIRELGASIRQISHRMNSAMIEYFTFNELISGLCDDFNKLSGMSVQLEMQADLPDMSNEMVLHIYRIAQELLTNAGKYARDSQVKIRITTGNGKLYLVYTDTGQGFEAGKKSKTSMGISNIFERTILFSGQAFLKTAPGKGTTWEIIFPAVQKDVV